ncbi:MAG: hypothetical protein IKE34_12990 [Paenibacillus sp.]|nr:hypothetical protein [Paenibacillus sp.]
MLDHILEQVDKLCDGDINFIGLMFRFSAGIAIIDKYFDEHIDDGFIVEWVSFDDSESAISVVCKDVDELHAILQKVAN